MSDVQRPLHVLVGDCRETLKTLLDGSVHCVVTSPPYWGLRDYGTARWEGGDAACRHVVGEIRTGLGMAKLGAQYRGGGVKAAEPKPMTAKDTCPQCGARRVDAQLGLEATPEAYVAAMVAVFREVRRVLRADGTCWINIGDSYATGAGAVGQCPGGGEQGERWKGNRGDRPGSPKHANGALGPMTQPNRMPIAGLKPKDLVGIPWMLAFALRADGWWLRSEIIWHKPNPMPESVTDRPTKAHEQVFLLTKAKDYFYDAEAIKEAASENTHERQARVAIDHKSKPTDERNGIRHKSHPSMVNSEGRKHGEHGLVKNNASFDAAMAVMPSSRNKRSVWTVATAPYAGAHFATFPPALITPMILAGTSARGCCPQCGAPWERVVEQGEADLEHQRACGGDEHGGYNGTSTKDYAAGKAQDASATKARILAGMRKRTTTAWNPTCECVASPEALAPVPCTVLDPFGGSGTTGRVALELGRHAILCELNPAYAGLIDERTNVTRGLSF